MKILGSIGNNRTRVLLTAVHLHALHGRCTVREVAQGAGLSLSSTHHHLRRLCDEGLIDWPEGTQGTITPKVKESAL